MHRFSAVVSIAATLILGAGVGGSLVTNAQDGTPSAASPTSAGTVIYDTAGRVVAVALVMEDTDGVAGVFVTATGLEPGEHGLHAHETGVCEPTGEKAFSSAGGHVNPTGAEHGGHAGDLGNIVVNADGVGSAVAWAKMLTLEELTEADGAAIVIHARADLNDAEGTSYGGRIACGVLTTAAPVA